MRSKFRITSPSASHAPLDLWELGIDSDIVMIPFPSTFKPLGIHQTIHPDGKMHIRKNSKITTCDVLFTDYFKLFRYYRLYLGNWPKPSF